MMTYFSEMLIDLFRFSTPECPAMIDGLAFVVQEVRDRIDAAFMDERFHIHVVNWCSEDARRMGKRGRIDRDFKEAVCVNLVKRRRVASGAQALRVLGGCSANNAQSWESDAVACWLNAATRTFPGAVYASMASDGDRLGDPAEENVAVLTHCLPQDFATYC